MKSWEVSRRKKHWISTARVSNSGSPLRLIMCKAHFHIEIRLHFKLGVGGKGADACHQLSVFVKRAIASI